MDYSRFFSDDVPSFLRSPVREIFRKVDLTSPDIRDGIAMLLAAMSANGVSEINNIEQIDRGYEDIDTRLRTLGAVITRK